jgi:hypothetical protein
VEGTNGGRCLDREWQAGGARGDGLLVKEGEGRQRPKEEESAEKDKGRGGRQRRGCAIG